MKGILAPVRSDRLRSKDSLVVEGIHGPTFLIWGTAAGISVAGASVSMSGAMLDKTVLFCLRVILFLVMTVGSPVLKSIHATFPILLPLFWVGGDAYSAWHDKCSPRLMSV